MIVFNYQFALVTIMVKYVSQVFSRFMRLEMSNGG